MFKFLLLAIGGATGTLLRYSLSGFIHKNIQEIFPWGTLVVNLLGCLLIGVLWELFQDGIITANMRLFLFIGVLGGFTTFSSFTLETFNLLKDGEFRFVLLNVFLSNFLGIALVFVGSALSRFVLNFFK